MHNRVLFFMLIVIIWSILTSPYVGEISSDAIAISLAIISAGALAGGKR